MRRHSIKVLIGLAVGAAGLAACGSKGNGASMSDPVVFEAGDTFFIEQGAVSDFKTDGYVRKFYCIFQPKKAAAKSEAAE